MSVVTDTTNHENEVGGGVLAWQMAGAWIPAYAGMTEWLVAVYFQRNDSSLSNVQIPKAGLV